MKRGSMWQKTGYLWITVAGVSAVLVTGFMLVEMDTEPRAGQGSGSTTQALSAQAKTTYKKGDTLNLEAGMPLYTQVIDNKVPADRIEIQYYTSSNEKIKVQAVRGEWIKFEDYSRGELWIPGWYASKESRSMKTITPQTFSLRSGSKLYLAPGSSTSWSPSPSLTDQAVIVAASKDWYGVSIAPRIWNKESFTYRPALLWIKAQSIEQQVIVADGWFQQDASQSALAVRHLTDIMLNKKTTSKQVKQWLGEPDWKENSANLNDTGYVMSIGQTWRYERADAQFLVTFNKNGKLARTRWNIPQDDRNNVVSDWSFGRSDEYEFTTKITGKSLPITLPWKPIWTNQGDINYTFLQAATDDVLLMKGDDGGFSGGYYEGSIYALDRHSGQKLWQVNSGYGALQAYIDANREAVTIYTSYDPDQKEYVDRIRHLRLKDGEVTWEYTPQKQIRLKGITAAKNVLIVDNPAAEGSSNGRITVLNSLNGKTLWTRKLSTGYQLLNQSADDPYVMYWEKNKLVAVDPKSGRTVWSLKSKRSTIEQLVNDSYFDGVERLDPFAPAQPERWMLQDHQWVLLDLNTGAQLANFPAREGQRFEVLNDGMLLIRENKKGDHYGEFADFTTTLYDPKSNKKLWVMNGKIERGFVEDDQLYVIKNGYPAALAYDSGETRWNAQNTIAALRYPTNQGSYLVIDDQLLLPMGEDLLIMDKHDGTLMGRVHDVVMGDPEHRNRDAKNGTINRLGNEIYIGSSNGRFSIYEASDLNISISR
ncbi:PQQ-binding-like beta-propeller repeat protein [Paenibacillus sp. F6_3S_P_1C]|uniref:PQQ-binding-like beta-propeller repeat protein n=1 Tax=Paenibacillus vandeheii TaxID=3035917 RepID=A0ABT8JJS2_9BACL|nr:PQQ-binding-like beta-propeller repeat protein [Paenibacillus vandeheii]MDN4604816.1 PQQ-binding-like beta-propeller repeat protein [Paenibacillus vandeheii]